jgi:hypothetical protein
MCRWMWGGKVQERSLVRSCFRWPLRSGVDLDDVFFIVVE